MNPYDELVAALFRRVAACRNPKTTRFLGRWPGAGSPAEHLDWGARLLHDAPLAHCRPLAGLNKNTFFFRGRALRPPHAGCPRGDPGSRLPPGYYRSRLSREIYLLLIVNLLKLTPSSKPVPCPLRASETSPLVMA